jgi:hypothetical protein
MKKAGGMNRIPPAFFLFTSDDKKYIMNSLICSEDVRYREVSVMKTTYTAGIVISGIQLSAVYEVPALISFSMHGHE